MLVPDQNILMNINVKKKKQVIKYKTHHTKQSPCGVKDL